MGTDGDIRYNTTLNVFEGYQNGSWLSLGAYLTSTQTINFPSTAANASSSSVFAVIGASVGDAVLVGPPVSAATQGSYFGYVSFSGTVTVRFNNDGSGTFDPPSGTFVIKILK